jgi:hypothetical protein
VAIAIVADVLLLKLTSQTHMAKIAKIVKIAKLRNSIGTETATHDVTHCKDAKIAKVRASIGTSLMADDASRLWSLTNDQFLTHFNQSYPQPQSWTLAHLPSQLVLPVISSLQGTQLPMPTLPDQPRQNGQVSARNATWNRSLPMLLTPSNSSWYLPSNMATAPCPKVVTLSELVPHTTSSAKLARQWPYWGAPTLASFHLASLISGSHT